MSLLAHTFITAVLALGADEVVMQNSVGKCAAAHKCRALTRTYFAISFRCRDPYLSFHYNVVYFCVHFSTKTVPSCSARHPTSYIPWSTVKLTRICHPQLVNVISTFPRHTHSHRGWSLPKNFLPIFFGRSNLVAGSPRPTLFWQRRWSSGGCERVANRC